MMPLKNSIATKLLKMVFAVYLVVTVTVTVIHMATEYSYTRKQVVFELERIQTVFYPTLSRALWEMNDNQVRSALQGLEHLPAVVGFQVEDNNGHVIAKAGRIQKADGTCALIDDNQGETIETGCSGLFGHEFKLTYSRGNKSFDVGHVHIYSSESVVFNKVALGFAFLLINAVVKTTALLLIFLYVFRRILLQPLSNLTNATRSIDPDNLENASIDIKTTANDELKALESAFNGMIEKLLSARRKLNEYARQEKDSLEAQVAERTRELALSEKKYRDSEAEMKALFASMTDVILVLDREGRYLKVAPTSPSLLYKPSDELIDKTLHEVFSMEEAKRFLVAIHKSLSTQSTVKIEYELAFGDQKVWFDGHISPISEDSVIFVARDITDRRKWELELENAKYATEKANEHLHREIVERKRVAEELRAREHQLRLITDNSPAYIAYVSIEDLCYQFVNKKFVKSYNLPRQEIIGRHIREIIGEANYRFALPYIAKVKEGKPVSYENEFPLSHGKRWVQVNYVPDFDEQGMVRGIVVMSLDVSEQKNAEELLRESEERFRNLFENMIEGVAIHELVYDDLGNPVDYTVIGVNPMYKVHTGLQSSEVLGRKASEIYGTGEPPFFDVYSKVALTGKASEMEVYFEPMDKFFHVSIFSPCPDQFVTVFENVTERKKAEATLHQAKETAESASRAKSEFLANMSHELRTPLNAILGFSELMQRDSGLTRDQRANLETIGRSGEHLLSLINDVLEFSKIEAGRIDLNKKSFDLHRLLQDLKQMFLLRTRQKGLTLRFLHGADIPRTIHTDQSKLRQILINLLGNAIKFTETGGITLSVQRKLRKNETPTGCFLEFTVIDTGIGISGEEEEKIFEAFIQSGNNRRMQQGTGLGLPISKKYVELLGGSLKVQSKLGESTHFSFTIPVEYGDDTSIERPHPRTNVIRLAENQSTFRILVAEDNINNRTLLVTLLRSVGFEVKEAVDGREAIDIWQKWQPHLIWMDIHMPEMDGYKATATIKSVMRQTKSSTETKIIALTASAFDKDRRKAFEHGADDFVSKPYREYEIFEIMRSHLGVQYIYEEENEHNPAGSFSEIPEHSLAALLMELPQELVDRLQEAVELSDAVGINAVIEDITKPNAELGRTLAKMAENFAYDTILKIAKQV